MKDKKDKINTKNLNYNEVMAGLEECDLNIRILKNSVQNIHIEKAIKKWKSKKDKLMKIVNRNFS